jgi:hypothetical protein
VRRGKLGEIAPPSVLYSASSYELPQACIGALEVALDRAIIVVSEEALRLNGTTGLHPFGTEPSTRILKSLSVDGRLVIGIVGGWRGYCSLSYPAVGLAQELMERVVGVMD